MCTPSPATSRRSRAWRQLLHPLSLTAAKSLGVRASRLNCANPRGRQNGLHLEEGSPSRDKANRTLYGRLAPGTCARACPCIRANCPQPPCPPSHSCSSGIRGCDELRNCPRNHTRLCPCPHVRACWSICAESRCRTVCPRRLRGTPSHRAPSLPFFLFVVSFVRHDAHFHALLPGFTPATGRHQYDWEMLGICHDV